MLLEISLYLFVLAVKKTYTVCNVPKKEYISKLASDECLTTVLDRCEEQGMYFISRCSLSEIFA